MKIKELRIKHYKSIKDIHLKPKRVNIFIGEPNSGKSNILEALTFFSSGGVSSQNFKTLFRFKLTRDLFFDFDLSKKIEVITDQISATMEFAKNQNGAILNYFDLKFFSGKQSDKKQNETLLGTFIFDHNGNSNQSFDNFNTSFRTYSYKRLDKFQQSFRNFLDPPYGDNLPTLVLSFPEIRKIVSLFFREKGYKLQLKPSENDIQMSREFNDELYSYPYVSLSETLQRIIFMMLAIESNQDSVLTFDEPESNTFPFYTKYIAERIALDKSNQYFITTHNPYLLLNIIEKMPYSDLNVIVTKMKDFQTKLYVLNKKQLEKAIGMGYDLYFNLDKIIAK